MNKNYAAILFVLFFAAGELLTAKEKTISPKEQKVISTDIGNPTLAGSTKNLIGGMELTSGGADVWGKRDEFRFAYTEVTGDFDRAVRVESLTAANLYTKAGLMARESLTEDSRHIFFQVFPDNSERHNNNGGYEFQYRQECGGEMKAIYPANATGKPEFPVNYPNTWIRLKRSGNEFTGFASSDGKNWKKYTSFTLDLPQKIYFGMAVTSHNPTKTATAVFHDLTMIK